MYLLGIAVMTIFAITSVGINQTLNGSEPEEAMVVERREGLPFHLVIFAIMGAIAGITIFVLRKKGLIF
jgi:hypothetical protein